jgi:excinuclease UvrABC nuclease subunit
MKNGQEPRYTVYLFFDAEEQPVYIGCTREPWSRLGPQREWWREASYAHFEHYDSRAEALDRERRLIEHMRPKYNRRFVDPPTARKDHLPIPALVEPEAAIPPAA